MIVVPSAVVSYDSANISTAPLTKSRRKFWESTDRFFFQQLAIWKSMPHRVITRTTTLPQVFFRTMKVKGVIESIPRALLNGSNGSTTSHCDGSSRQAKNKERIGRKSY